VLKELPPKVIQDYSCTMPALQFKAHMAIERVHPFADIMQGGKKEKKKQNVLQNLILHRKVCNHPMLVKHDLKSEFPCT